MTSRPEAAEPKSPSIGAFVRAPDCCFMRLYDDETTKCHVLRHAQRSEAPCTSVIVTFGESSAKVESTTRSCSASEAEMQGARVVSRREAGHWSSGLAHKLGCVALKLLNVRLHAEPRGSRLLVDQGTRDSGSATARSPASRRHKVPREQSVPRILDHQPGRMWIFVLAAGSSPAIVLACATTSSASATVVTTRPGGGMSSSAVGPISSQTMPSTLEVALGGLGRRSSQPHLGISEAI
jgi:hypothetical protein